MPLNIYSPVEHRKERSGIVSIGIPDGRNREMIVKLEKDNIYTSLRLDKIRIAVNFFNDTMDIDRLCMGIADS
jgi:selenocysteine lyase/cysteine desulfurase